MPRRQALELIRRHEGFDRGAYSGTVGWIDAEGNGDLAVAIRSALVRPDEAMLYAGGGIVASSDPASELEETRLKLAMMLEAITQ
jgi:isochorismate synthase EntC